MPEPDPLVRRQPPRLPLQHRQTDVEAGQRQEASHERAPDHDLGPECAVAAQDRRVQPVRHRAQPVPEPPGPGGQLDGCSGAAGNVDLAARPVAQGHLVERTVRIEFPRDRPLIAIDDVQRRRLLHDRRLVLKERFRHAESLPRPDPPQRRAARQIQHDVLSVRCLHAHDGVAAQILNHGGDDRLAVGQWTGIGEPATVPPVDRLQALQPLRLRKLGKAHEHHHGAREAPDEHEQTDSDAEITVQDQQPSRRRQSDAASGPGCGVRRNRRTSGAGSAASPGSGTRTGSR